MHRYFLEKTVNKVVRSDEFRVLKIDGFLTFLASIRIHLKNVFISPVAEAFRKLHLRMRSSTSRMLRRYLNDI